MIASRFMLFAGFIPKLGAMITMIGIKVIIKDELSSRNVSVVGLSVALGMGITQVLGALDPFHS